VEELETSTPKEVFYFFFRSGTPDLEISSAAYRSILAQVIQRFHHSTTVLDKVGFAMTTTSSGQSSATYHEILELLQLYASDIGEGYVILDGIDECTEGDQLMKDLRRVFQDSKMKALVFSRPNVRSLIRITRPQHRLRVGTSNSRDIAAFCSRRLNVLVEDGLLPSNADISDLSSHLVVGADGMFLWARLMFALLESTDSFSAAQRLSTILEVTLPEGLDAIYSRILQRIRSKPSRDRETAMAIIQWVVFALRTISERELAAVLQWKQTRVEPINNASPDLERTVVMVCAGLVERVLITDPRYNERVPCYRAIHLSVKEFLVTQDPSSEQNLRKDYSIKSHFELSQSCLQTLLSILPDGPLSGTKGQNFSRSELHVQYPLCSYASLFWIDHLREGTKLVESHRSHASKIVQVGSILQPLLDTFREIFLHGSVLMAWIEACYSLGTWPNYADLLDWSHWALRETNLIETKDAQQVIGKIKALGTYLQELDDGWGAQLLASPCAIWEEVTGYTPTELFFRKSSTKVDSLCIDGLSGSDTSTHFLCKVSEVSRDTRFMSVLSIWPSR
jgi:hypothetical protein